MDVLPVLSLSTRNPRRVHLMDDDGRVLCGLWGRFCRADAKTWHQPQTCVSCQNRHHNLVIASEGAIENAVRAQEAASVASEGAER